MFQGRSRCCARPCQSGAPRRKRILLMNLNKPYLIVVMLLVLLLAASCRTQGETVGSPTVATGANLDSATAADDTATEPDSSSESAALPPTITPIPPTPTPTEPLAAVVNGEPIFLSTYEKQLARFQQSDPESGIDYQPIALNSIIDNTLITQAALAAGHTVSEAQIDQELAALIASVNGRENFEAWLDANFYTEVELRDEIAFGFLSAPLLSEVVASVPTTSDQVRARYIKVSDEAAAVSILTQLDGGADFAALANQFSLPEQGNPNPTGGDMGFFEADWPLEGIPQAVKDAAFALQPGQTSQVIASAEPDGTTAYYLVQTVERDPQRPLPQSLLDQMRQNAILEWTQSLRQNATIEVVVDIGS